MPEFTIRDTNIEEMQSPRLKELQALHASESGTHSHLMQPSFDAEKYKTLNEAGLVVPLVAVLDDEVIGYSINMLDNHIHFKELLSCVNLTFYMTMANRAKYGLQLIRETIKHAAAKGAKLMVWQANADSEFATLMTRRKCAIEGLIFSEEI